MFAYLNRRRAELRRQNADVLDVDLNENLMQEFRAATPAERIAVARRGRDSDRWQFFQIFFYVAWKPPRISVFQYLASCSPLAFSDPMGFHRLNLDIPVSIIDYILISRYPSIDISWPPPGGRGWVGGRCHRGMGCHPRCDTCPPPPHPSIVFGSVSL